jgi:hypothetical protein
MAGGVEYNDISLGYGMAEGLTELAIRVFWRQWHALIRGLERPERWNDATASQLSGAAVAS